MLWYKVKGGKAHAILHVYRDRVEFWCGKGRRFDEIKPAQYNDAQCSECYAYINNRKSRLA